MTEYRKTESGLLVPQTELDKYRTHHAAKWDPPYPRGYTLIDVLPFLWGKKLDETTLNFIHALRPSSLRITRGEVTCDAMTWRVTVIVDEDDIVEKIEQEVEVGLRSEENGMTLSSKVRQ